MYLTFLLLLSIYINMEMCFYVSNFLIYHCLVSKEVDVKFAVYDEWWYVIPSVLHFNYTITISLLPYYKIRLNIIRRGNKTVALKYNSVLLTGESKVEEIYKRIMTTPML